MLHADGGSAALCLSNIASNADLANPMPVKDPNQIDVAKAAALYVYLRNWYKVAAQMKRPNGTEYQVRSIIQAVKRRTKESPDAKAKG